MGSLGKVIVDAVLGFAKKGKWAVLIVTGLLFGAVGLVDTLWPGNPLSETFNAIRAGMLVDPAE